MCIFILFYSVRVKGVSTYIWIFIQFDQPRRSRFGAFCVKCPARFPSVLSGTCETADSLLWKPAVFAYYMYLFVFL